MHNGSTILAIVNKIVVYKKCFIRLHCYVFIVIYTLLDNAVKMWLLYWKLFILQQQQQSHN
jgi:hypothetical protein